MTTGERPAAAVASPCNSVCRIDERNGLCLGCYRTLAEIAAWSAMDDAERRALRAELPSRRLAARRAAGQGQGEP